MEWLIFLAQAFLFLICYYVGRYYFFNPSWNHPLIFKGKVFVIILTVIVPLMTIFLPIYAFIADIYFWWFLLFSLLGWMYVSYKARVGSAIDAYNRGELEQYSHLFETTVFEEKDDLVLTEEAKQHMRNDLEKILGVPVPDNDK